MRTALPRRPAVSKRKARQMPSLLSSAQKY